MMLHADWQNTVKNMFQIITLELSPSSFTTIVKSLVYEFYLYQASSLQVEHLKATFECPGQCFSVPLFQRRGIICQHQGRWVYPSLELYLQGGTCLSAETILCIPKIKGELNLWLSHIPQISTLIILYWL